MYSDLSRAFCHQTVPHAIILLFSYQHELRHWHIHLIEEFLEKFPNFGILKHDQFFCIISHLDSGFPLDRKYFPPGWIKCSTPSRTLSQITETIVSYHIIKFSRAFLSKVLEIVSQSSFFSIRFLPWSLPLEWINILKCFSCYLINYCSFINVGASVLSAAWSFGVP